MAAAQVMEHGADCRTLKGPGPGEAEPLHIVHVEDREADARLFEALLRKIPFMKPPLVRRARRIAEACVLVRESPPDCILLDLRLPDAVGLSGLGAIRGVSPDPAIVMLTSIEDEVTASEAVDHGAQDYLVKANVDAMTLGRAILRGIQRHRRMTELSARCREAEYRATHDALTGLCNRRSFDEALRRKGTQSLEDDGRWGVLLLDLDGFKAINDRDGHLVGDAVLKATAQRLRDCVRSGDLVCRLGGDEFVILVSRMPAAPDHDELVQRIRDAVREPIDIGSSQYIVSASIGSACFLIDGVDPAELMAAADRRMYADKGSHGHAIPAERPGSPG